MINIWLSSDTVLQISREVIGELGIPFITNAELKKYLQRHYGVVRFDICQGQTRGYYFQFVDEHDAVRFQLRYA